MSDKKPSAEKIFQDAFHDNIVAMQSALIEWKFGKGSEAALQWIVNTLMGPGLLPDFDAPHGRDAQKWFDANQSNPMPPCEICKEPSCIVWMGMGFCCEAHEKQRRLN